MEFQINGFVCLFVLASMSHVIFGCDVLIWGKKSLPEVKTQPVILYFNLLNVAMLLSPHRRINQ